MHNALIENIGRKNIPLKTGLWQNKAISFIRLPLSGAMDKIREKVLFALEEMRVLLVDIYKDIDTLDEQETKELCPQVRKIRKTIYKYSSKFAQIKHADTTEVCKEFNKLRRIANRVESKTRKQIYSFKEIERQKHSKVKNKLRENTQKAFVNANL